MNKLENKLIDLLTDLKQNHKIIGIKTEFEDEGASFEEAFYLSELVNKVGLNLTIKIGGCGAINDINQAKNLNASSIVAPMIESGYALKKFVESINIIYKDENLKPDLYINIETINGYKNFAEMINIPEYKKLKGVIAGRFDLAKSIGLKCKDCDGIEIFNIVNSLAKEVYNTEKKFFIGGGVKINSLEFFNKLSNPFYGFETRKIIFDANFSIKNNDAAGIIKAINFEIDWIKLKQSTFKMQIEKDLIRLKTLEKRIQIQQEFLIKY